LRIHEKLNNGKKVEKKILSLQDSGDIRIDCN
jgi:predicted RNA-binding protein with RPS1 domain